MAVEQERRLLFGSVAERYDATRPSYPEQLVDDVVAFVPAAPAEVLEVGAGTGKATVQFATRQTHILATEPGDGMVEVLRRNCAGLTNVDVEQTDFESYEPGPRSFDLVISAQAWHWVAGDRYGRAASLIRAGGALALFWNLATLARSGVRSALISAYREHAPDAPIHVPPTGRESYDAENRAWVAEIDAAGCFGPVVRKTYWWSATYRAREYADMTSTHSDHLVLPDGGRRVADAVAEAIDAHGGTITIDYGTDLFLARRS